MYEPIDLGEPPEARCFQERLNTFTNWPNPHVSPEVLAKAGFQYTRVADIVRCIFCGVEGYQWYEGDDPLAYHVKWKPDCPFLTKRIPPKRCRIPEDEAPSSSGSTKRIPPKRCRIPEDEASTSTGRLCKICYVHEMTVVVNPCHHLFACVNCALALSSCAICRRNIESVVRVFIC